MSSRSNEGVLVLTRGDVAALLDMDACIAAVEESFRAYAEGRAIGPAVLGVDARPGGVFHVKAAGLRDARPYFAAKLNANFPGNPVERGLPTIQGVLTLFDAESGTPIAVMDAAELTSVRTAAATAVAAKYLALPAAQTVTVIGCGVQGRAQLEALTRVRPVRLAYAADGDRARARAFAAEMSARLGITVEVSDDVGGAIRSSDVCVTCTPAREIIVRPSDAHPGLFIAAVGADNHDKQELDARLVASSVVVADITEQCAREGELHHAIAAGLMRVEDVRGDLASVVSGAVTGRRSPDEVIVFDSTGTAIEDVAAAAVVYERALAGGRGARVVLLD